MGYKKNLCTLKQRLKCLRKNGAPLAAQTKIRNAIWNINNEITDDLSLEQCLDVVNNYVKGLNRDYELILLGDHEQLTTDLNAIGDMNNSTGLEEGLIHFNADELTDNIQKCINNINKEIPQTICCNNVCVTITGSNVGLLGQHELAYMDKNLEVPGINGVLVSAMELLKSQGYGICSWDPTGTNYVLDVYADFSSTSCSSKSSYFLTSNANHYFTYGAICDSSNSSCDTSNNFCPQDFNYQNTEDVAYTSGKAEVIIVDGSNTYNWFPIAIHCGPGTGQPAPGFTPSDSWSNPSNFISQYASNYYSAISGVPVPELGDIITYYTTEEKLDMPSWAAGGATNLPSDDTWRLPTLYESMTIYQSSGVDGNDDNSATPPDEASYFINTSNFLIPPGGIYSGDCIDASNCGDWATEESTDVLGIAGNNRWIDGQCYTYTANPTNTMVTFSNIGGSWAETDKPGDTSVIGVNYLDGRIKSYSYDVPKAKQALLIHGGTKDLESASDRFNTKSDYIIEDTLTNLQWCKYDHVSLLKKLNTAGIPINDLATSLSGSRQSIQVDIEGGGTFQCGINWETAFAFAQAVESYKNVIGLTDDDDDDDWGEWRLPNIKEASSITNVDSNLNYWDPDANDSTYYFKRTAIYDDFVVSYVDILGYYLGNTEDDDDDISNSVYGTYTYGAWEWCSTSLMIGTGDGSNEYFDYYQKVYVCRGVALGLTDFTDTTTDGTEANFTDTHAPGAMRVDFSTTDAVDNVNLTVSAVAPLNTILISPKDTNMSNATVLFFGPQNDHQRIAYWINDMETFTTDLLGNCVRLCRSKA